MTIIEHQPYVTDDAYGDSWHLMLGDSCERLAEIPDNSVGLSVYSPPFASLFTYSPSERDLGNSTTRDEFIQHYRFIVEEVLRVMMPGRISAVHCQQITTQKARDGHVGLTDFRGDLIRAHIEAGWIFHGEVTIDKDPQAQAIRTKKWELKFQGIETDRAMSRGTLCDYLLKFRAPGENEVPIDQHKLTRNEWIEWAEGVWDWRSIRETDTLNTKAAKSDDDTRHICPLQLPVIRRCVRLFSNPGETVFTPFMGVGSEVYSPVLLEIGRASCRERV
jgi:hypothetical protein